MFTKVFIFALLAVGSLADFKFLSFTNNPNSPPVPPIALSNPCDKIVKNDKLQLFEGPANAFVVCLRDNIDPFIDEIRAAQEKKEFNGVFKKPCESKQQIKTCVNNSYNQMKACVDDEIKNKVESAKKIAYAFVDFVCENDGENADKFYEADGFKCYSEKVDGFRICVESLNNKFPDAFSSNTISLEDKCADIDKLVSCMVGNMETCKSPTPAKTIEGLYKAIRKSSPCDGLKN